MLTQPLIQILIIAGLIGAASGAVGAFIILRRMALVGDALSHVALPGIALALFWELDPFWGILTFLVGAALLVWWLEGRTRLYGDAIVGLMFTTSLALGVLFIPDAELLESIFGEFPPLVFTQIVLIALSAAAIVFAVFLFTNKFLFAVVSPELSAISDRRRWSSLLFFLLFSFAVALGIKLMGTLLMGALTVIPASIAKNAARSSASYIAASALFGGVISAVGAWFAFLNGLLPGPTIILFGVAVFILSLVFARRV